MKFTKCLIIFIGLLAINKNSCMDNPAVNQQAVSPLKEGALLLCEQICKEVCESYQGALESPDIPGFSKMQKAKNYLKTKIEEQKQKIAQAKVAVNFDFLADPQVSTDVKFNYSKTLEDMIETRKCLLIELIDLELAYKLTKVELLDESLQRIKRERGLPALPPLQR